MSQQLDSKSAIVKHKLPRLRSWLLIVGLIVLAILLTPWLVGPSCPRRVVIATGSPDGAYHYFATRYRDILKRDGIELEVMSTAGSLENLKLLDANHNDVSLAIVQGGTGSPQLKNPPQSLASLYLEPVWVFCKSETPIKKLIELKGKRIAVDAAGSGTRSVALQLLQDNNMSGPKNLWPQTKLVELGGRRAVEALKNNQIDAAFFVISPQSPIVHELLQADGIQLIDFSRARAYQRRYPFLSSITISEGMLDLKRNLPSSDLVLLPPTANLVASRGLHSALVPLILKSAVEVHGNGGLLEVAGSFPSAANVEFSLNRDARRYWKSGPSLLFKYLPFRLAAWLDQMKLLLLPLCTLLLPLLKMAPPIYRWRIRSKIYRWYRVLREVDQKMKAASGPTDFSSDIDALIRLDKELSEVSVPLSYMEEFYNLRLHVSYVLKRLEDLQDSTADSLRRAA